jgi:hypothetical protein
MLFNCSFHFARSAPKMAKSEWYERPEPRPNDQRDQEEHAAIAAALANVVADHPARIALRLVGAAFFERMNLISRSFAPDGF